MWGPARVSGQIRECYFLLVVDDYTRYTTVFPLCSKGQDLPVLRLHSNRGGEFSSNLLRDFCRGEGILQSFTLPDSPQQNGIAERRIGLVMEVARTSMIHAAAPHFLWPFAVQYAAHQLNLWPRVSLQENSPTLRWMGKVGDASVFWVWGSRAIVRDPSADKLSAHAILYVFLGFVPDAPGWQFYHPTSRRPAPLGVSQVDPPPGAVPGEVAVDSGAARGTASRGAELGGAGPGGAKPGDPLLGPAPVQVAVDSGAARGTASGGAEPGGAESEGAKIGGAEPGGVATGGAEPEGIEPGGAALEGAESKGAEPRGAASSGAFGAGGAGAARDGGTGVAAGAGVTGGTATTRPGGACTPGTRAARTGGSQLLLQPASPLPAPSPYTEQSGGLTERHEPVSRPVLPVRTARRVSCSRPPPVPGTHAMTLRPSSVPLRVPLPAPPESSLPESAAPSDHVAELLDFASASPPSVGGECALGTDVLEGRQEDFECLAAAVPRFASLLLASEGDPDAPDIPTPRSYAEAITGPYSSQRQVAMDAEMASWKVKRPPGSPPAFKARYVARGFSQRQGVDYFHTFSPTSKMTTLRVLLHVVAKRDFKLHSLDFSIANLQGSLHEEIWLCRPPGFTESFPAGTQWSLRRPVYGLRQAPREWHDTLRTTFVALGFAPATADPSLFLRTDTSLPPFYVLIYVDNLVFATADTEALTLVKSELQKRHTCTDLG
ncbi:unnamed protein product [Closterium sp. NIES-53]